MKKAYIIVRDDRDRNSLHIGKLVLPLFFDLRGFKTPSDKNPRPIIYDLVVFANGNTGQVGEPTFKEVELTNKQYYGLLEKYTKSELMLYKDKLKRIEQEHHEHIKYYRERNDDMGSLLHYYKGLLSEKMNLKERETAEQILRRIGGLK